MKPGPSGAGAFLLAVYLPVAALAAALPLLARLTGAPLSDFTRDVFSIAEIPVWSGLVSNVGMMLWCATATICAFAAVAAAGRGRERALLAGAALVSGVLLADDFFMVHEWVVPRLFGIPETVPLAAYAALLAALLVTFRRELLARRPGLLATALGLFALSVGMDLVEPEQAEWWRYWLEESFKLLGLASWFAYFTLAAAETVGHREGE